MEELEGPRSGSGAGAIPVLCCCGWPGLLSQEQSSITQRQNSVYQTKNRRGVNPAFPQTHTNVDARARARTSTPQQRGRSSSEAVATSGDSRWYARTCLSDRVTAAVQSACVARDRCSPQPPQMVFVDVQQEEAIKQHLAPRWTSPLLCDPGESQSLR